MVEDGTPDEEGSTVQFRQLKEGTEYLVSRWSDWNRSTEPAGAAWRGRMTAPQRYKRVHIPGQGGGIVADPKGDLVKMIDVGTGRHAYVPLRYVRGEWAQACAEREANLAAQREAALRRTKNAAEQEQAAHAAAEEATRRGLKTQVRSDGVRGWWLVVNVRDMQAWLDGQS